VVKRWTFCPTRATTPEGLARGGFGRSGLGLVKWLQARRHAQNCKNHFPAPPAGGRSLRPEAQRLSGGGKQGGAVVALVFNMLVPVTPHQQDPSAGRGMRFRLNWGGPAAAALQQAAAFQSCSPTSKKDRASTRPCWSAGQTQSGRFGWRRWPGSETLSSKSALSPGMTGAPAPWLSTAADFRNLPARHRRKGAAQSEPISFVHAARWSDGPRKVHSGQPWPPVAVAPVPQHDNVRKSAAVERLHQPGNVACKGYQTAARRERYVLLPWQIQRNRSHSPGGWRN